jgi:hypothetical protein
VAGLCPAGTGQSPVTTRAKLFEREQSWQSWLIKELD